MNSTSLLQRLHPRLGFQAGMLALTVMLASTALSYANRLTQAPIAEAIAADTRRSLAEVLPQGSFDNDPVADVLTTADQGRPVVVHIARQHEVPNAVVLEIQERGYAGEIGLVVGISNAGKVLGVRVTRHSETPGLGDKIEVTKSDWIERFADLGLDATAPGRWAVKKDGGDFDQFAGATITPRAVVRGVKRALELHAREHLSWFARRSAD